MADLDHKTNDELLQTLRGLIRTWEREVVEFKQASNDYDKDKIGQYFSAISNEANLKGLQHGWLVFGVNNKTRGIVGSDYRDTRGLETLKHEIAQNTTGGITFIDVFEVYDDDNRVVMFKIPAAVTAVPTASLGVIEGKVPNVYVSAIIAEITDERAQYTKNKAMDDKYYTDLIINYLRQFGSGTKADFVRLLGDKLSDVLDSKQKVYKVRYFLTTMHKGGLIERTTPNKRTGAWRLAKKE